MKSDIIFTTMGFFVNSVVEIASFAMYTQMAKDEVWDCAAGSCACVRWSN